MHGTGSTPPTSGFESVEDEGGYDLRDLLDSLIEGRWLIASVFVATLVLSGLYLWLARPVYQADGLVQVELQQKGMGAALGELGELIGGGTIPVSAELELVKSRLVMGRVVDALRLEIQARPRYLPVLGQRIARSFAPTAEAPLRQPFLGTDAYAWGGERLEITRLEVPEHLIEQPLTLRATEAGYELLDEDGRVLVAGKAGEAAQGTVDGFPVGAFVQELVARPGTEFEVMRQARQAVIKTLQQQMRVAEKGRMSGIISVTYEHTDPAMAVAVVNETVTAYRDQNVERRSAEAAQTLEFLNEQLPKVRERVEAAEGELNKFRLRHGSADLTKETELVLQQSVAVETTRMGLEQKKQEMLRRFTADHPAVQAIDAQLAQAAHEQESIAGRVRGLPETQQELLRLSRDAQVATELYTALLNNAQELQIAKAGTIGNVRIIDRALRPMRPAKPKKGLTLALAGMLGLMLGVVAVFVRLALKHGVQDPAVVERVFGIANYGVVPFTRTERSLWRKERTTKQHLLAVEAPEDTAIESLRSLRTALHFARLDAKNNVVMLTGPSPGVGKSFISVNLGAVLAAGDKKVVVVDADMRRGHLHNYVGCQRAPGVSDYIAGSCELEATVCKTPVTGLELVPSGTNPPNPSELLLNSRFAQLLEKLGARFDYVLVDTPPVLAVTDASIVGALAGTTLLVLKAGEHPLRAIEESVRRLRHAGVDLKGTVFNQVQVHSRRYGYQYGYGYTYGKAKG